jgi:hypothetical protein
VDLDDEATAMTRNPTPRTRKRKTIRPVPGDCILAGAPGTTMPSDWFFAKVLWADGDDVVTEHDPPSGTKYRQILHISHVRAIGSLAELVQFKESRRVAVHRLAMRVHKAECALGAARNAVWVELDAIAANVGVRG